MGKRLLSVVLAMMLCLVMLPAIQAQGVETLTGPIKQISLSCACYCSAIDANGSLWTWGENGFGHLGDGTTVNRSSPVKVMSNVATVSLSISHSAAIKTDGSLWTWGDNGDGQLGDGTTTHRYTPIKVMDNVAAVSLGGSYSAVIKTDGSLWTWGRNYLGQLGDGTTTHRFTPVKVMNNVAAVSLSYNHGAAIKTDGSLWTWGGNGGGQLGDGTNTRRYTPIKVMDNVAAVSLGSAHSAAIKTDGSLWTWGDNEYGQLGDGTTVNRSTPIKVMDNVVAVSLSSRHGAAIKTDGSLWTWGGNGGGQLGDGTNTRRYTPIKVMDNVAAVSLGSAHSAAIKTDGSLWTWGDNEYGQLGNGTRSARYTPVCIAKSSGVPAPAKPCRLSELTDLDYLAFSDLAYKDPPAYGGTTIKDMLVQKGLWNTVWSENANIKYSELYDHIQGWKFEAYSEDLGTGFFAAVYINNDEDAVITYRGSTGLFDFFEYNYQGHSEWWNDWVKNNKNMFLNRDGKQVTQSIRFYDLVNKRLPRYTFAVTGHSLGGGLADIVSAYSGCLGKSFNSAPFLDVAYIYHPDLMAKMYDGADRWNFVAHVDYLDPVGMVYNERKPRVVHPDQGLGSIPHVLESFASKSSNGHVDTTPGVDYSVGSSKMDWNTFSLSGVITGSSSSMLTMGTSRSDKLRGNPICRWTCYGGDGDDGITGTAHADVIIGGKGDDSITGGLGDDVYWYCKGDGADYIYDEGGHDKICLIGFSNSDSITVERTGPLGYITVCCNSVPIITVSPSRGWFSSFKIRVIDELSTDFYDITDLFDEKAYGKHYDISCPVDVQIIDDSGEVVYTVFDGISGIQDTEYGTFYVYEEENEEYGKSISLVDGYSVRIVGLAQGSMNVAEYTINEGVIENSYEASYDSVSDTMNAEIRENTGGEKHLEVDGDGDGTIDNTVPLSSVLTIVWLDGDGTILDEASYIESDEEPITSHVPTKEDDETYIYSFSEWDSGTVAGNTTTFSPCFTAVEDPLLTFIWLDGDNTELEKKTIRQSQDEPLTRLIPTKAETEDYFYTFAGWDSGTVDGNTTTYTPEFNEIARQQTDTNLRFANRSLTLYDNISIDFKINADAVEDYTDLYVAFDFNGEKSQVSDYTVDNQGRYVFKFFVAPNQLNDTVTATPHATKDGVIEITGQPYEYSVATYCYNMLNNSNYSGDEYAEFRTLLVDMLYYGEAAQVYSDHRTDALATANLTEEQIAMGTDRTAPMSYTSVRNLAYETVENPEAEWQAGSLYLYDTVEVQFKFTAADIENLHVRVTDGTRNWDIPVTGTVDNNGRYYVSFRELNASEMRTIVYATIYRGDTAVSNTFRYSIESYVATQHGKIDALDNLMDAMMRYGDSAYQFVH